MTWKQIQIEMFMQRIDFALTEVQRYIIQSYLNMGDFDEAEKMLAYWNPKPNVKRKVWIKKFIPGSHYHVYGVRHNFESDAREAIEKAGEECLGVQIQHFYDKDGD